MPAFDTPIQQAMTLAVTHHLAGRLREAENIYRQVLSQQPQNADALHLLGVIALQQGRNDAALELIGQAIALRPAFPEAHSNLGNALQNLKQLDNAIAAFRRAIALKPNYPDAHYNLGNVLKAKGQFDEAIAAYRQTIALQPNYAHAYGNLGNALLATGPLEQAVAACRQAIALKPDFTDAFINLGNALKEMGRLDEAIVAYRQAIALNPNIPDAHSNLGNALKDQGQLDEAIGAYRRALVLKPELSEARSNLIFAMHNHPDCDGAAIAEETRRWDLLHAQPLRPFILPHANERNPDRRLRIGYVSHDFCLHSVAFFLLPLLENHDKSQFHITGYCSRIQSDEMTQRLRGCCDDWRSLVGLSDEEAANLIRREQIDILIDLSGHTAGNRLLLFARKPAPVQVTYLGFPGNTGLRAIDYRVTDAFADPPAAEISESLEPYGEPLLRLPETAWCFAPVSGTPPIADLPALQNGRITFGSFNNLSKVTAPMLDLWADILKRVPASRLVLKSIAFRGQENIQRFQRLFAQRGLDPQRLQLLANQPSQLEHLQIYNQIDIALDTFPYHGTTTNCEALWMGVPVITLAGQRHASLVGVSLLSNVGLADLIAPSSESYVQIAKNLAGDLPRLAGLRGTLRERMRQSPLMNAARFADNMEAAYRAMWRKWCLTAAAP